MFDLRRRDLITLIGGAAAWPFAAHAQQPAMPVVGFLFAGPADGSRHYAAAFRKGLSDTGNVEGQNVVVEYHWLEGQYDRARTLVADMAHRRVAVIASLGATPVALAAKAATASIPIVFAVPDDPVQLGLVASLARPGGSATGFTMFEYGISAKWLELLKEFSPHVKRVAVLREPTVAGIGQLAAMQTAAPSFGVELQPIDARDVGEFERVLADFAGAPNGGLIVPLSTSSETHRTRIIALADRHRLPAVYPSRVDAALGGLISYGPDTVDRYRRAAGYVDRILKGEKPADLPVQAPTKYELVINLKTAKALGLTVPDSLLARADEVIE